MKPRIKIAIQDSYIATKYTEALVEACQKLDIDYECFGLISYTDGGFKITGDILEDTSSLIIPFGSVKIIKLWLEKKLPKNWMVFYNKKGFDITWQHHVLLENSKWLRRYFVNQDCYFKLFPECTDIIADEDYFVKPANDLKLFHAHVLKKGNTLAQSLLEQNINPNIYKLRDTVLFSSVKNVLEEYRCFVVNNSVQSCQYMKDGKIYEAETSIANSFSFLFLLLLEYNPTLKGDPYVVDIAKVVTDKGAEWKIMEYNAFQCSGFYAISVIDMMEDLVKFVEGKYV